MAEKVAPSSSMFFNNDREKYANSVIDLLKVNKQKRQNDYEIKVLNKLDDNFNKGAQ